MIYSSSSTALPKFADLEKHFPKADDQRQFANLGGGCQAYRDQCAIRMSAALQAVGYGLATGFEKKWGPTCTIKTGTDSVLHSRGAKALADYLWATWGSPKVLDSSSSAPINGLKGVVFFHEQVSGTTTVVYRHIDLWSGSDTKGYNGFGRGSATVWFWQLQ